MHRAEQRLGQATWQHLNYPHPHARFGYRLLDIMAGSGLACGVGAQYLSPLLDNDALAHGTSIGGTAYAVAMAAISYELASRLRDEIDRETRGIRRSYGRSVEYLAELGRENGFTESDIENAIEWATCLPPGGAKVIHPSMEPWAHVKFIPYITQELLSPSIVEKARDTMKRHKRQTPIVVQLTSAGRHNDNFKLAALTLATGHPYAENWHDPFFNAWWSQQFGPLIHDGPHYDHAPLNRRWKKAQGRTDYLMRLPADVFINDAESGVHEYIASRARFYQRASFAAHCARELHDLDAGTQKKPRINIPDKARIGGADIWHEYQHFVQRNLFGPLGLNSVTDAEWIGTKKRHVPGGGLRYEAEYEPIAKSLTQLEAVKAEAPRECVQRASACMDFLADSVDDLLGLPVSSRDPTFRPE